VTEQADTNDEPTTPRAEEQAEQPAEAAASDASASEQPAAQEPVAAGEGDAAGGEIDAGAAAETGSGGPAPPAHGSPAEPAEKLSSKERRRKTRSTHKGSTQPSRSPEERHQERIARRKQKAAYRSARRAKERTKVARRRRGEPASEQSLAPVHARVEGVRKVRQGVVVSDKADKTITVRIDVARRHRRYQKIVRSSSTLHAHDENNDAHEGDMVRVIESRPLSRSKRWNLVEVLERAR
jgi:small subunit ribosomal protein S17